MGKNPSHGCQENGKQAIPPCPSTLHCMICQTKTILTKTTKSPFVEADRPDTAGTREDNNVKTMKMKESQSQKLKWPAVYPLSVELAYIAKC